MDGEHPRLVHLPSAVVGPPHSGVVLRRLRRDHRRRETPTVCPKCGGTHLTRDEDVAGYWFSSALWPFSTLGWPENTADLSYFYPTHVLVTGYDIIFFWVARMIFSGIEQMGKPPFHTVLIHGLVRDAQGRKMSKSLGNGVDPLEIIDQYGADALRFSLVMGVSPGNDMRFSTDKVDPPATSPTRSGTPAALC